jgi:hypothetical protein
VNPVRTHRSVTDDEGVPFTGSHPAAVLPLVRRGLIPSALVIGSMAPDLGYFVPLHVGAGETHSPLGLVTVDLAIGAGAFAIWHLLLARPLWWASPAQLRSKIREPAQRLRVPTVRWFLLLVLSLTVGAATHILWDAFTHAGRFGTNSIGWLHTQHGLLPGYQWAQYGCSVLGIAVEALWLWAWWRRTEPHLEFAVRTARIRPVAVALWAAICVATVAAAGQALELSSSAGHTLRQTTYQVITRGGLGAFVAAALLAACWHVSRLTSRLR